MGSGDRTIMYQKLWLGQLYRVQPVETFGHAPAVPQSLSVDDEPCWPRSIASIQALNVPRFLVYVRADLVLDFRTDFLVHTVPKLSIHPNVHKRSPSGQPRKIERAATHDKGRKRDEKERERELEGGRNPQFDFPLKPNQSSFVSV